MKLAILGGTGPSGLTLVTQALAAGHDVTCIVRSPEKITTSHDKLTVVKGDIFSEKSLQEHIAGHDVVLSCLGFRPQGWLPEVSFYTDTIKPIVAGMRAAKVTRFILITSWCTNDEKGPWVMDWLVKPLYLKKLLKNMGDMENYLIECEDINFTAVKPPILDVGDVTDKAIAALEGQYIPGTGYPKIRRSDVAKFMLTCLDTNVWDRKLVAIGHTT